MIDAVSCLTSRRTKMLSYSATIQIDDTTRAFLQTNGYTLYLFKGINAGPGATSTIWLTLSGNQLYDQASNTITWQEEYYIGEENTQIQNGASVSGTNPFVSPSAIVSVSLGQNYIFPGTAWNPQSTAQPNDEVFTIQNTEASVNNFYVSQKVSTGPEDYIVVTKLLGSGGLGTFMPIETIAMILSTQPYSTGTMITEAFSPGAIVTLAGITSASLSYDMNTGWSATAGQLTAGRYPAAPLEAPLPSGKTAKSKAAVNGVRIKGISGVTYGNNAKVTVKCGDSYEYIAMTDNTDKLVGLGKGVYQVTNNSGGTIRYEWTAT